MVDEANVSGTIENMEKFLDTKFIEGVVRQCFDDLARDFKIQKDMVSQRAEQGTDSRLILRLENEIDFLRDEIRNKNKIIEILVSERNSISHNTHNTQNSICQTEKISTKTQSRFEFPKRHARSSKTQLSQQNDYIHENQFNPLLPFDDTFNDETNDAVNESNTQQKNFDNITERKKPKLNEKKSVEKKRYVAIVGDSIVKEVKGHLLSTKKETVVVKTFSGATTKQMYDYVNPTLEMEPDQIIIHVGTNDLKKCENNQEVAKDIVNLALHCHQKNSIPIVVSSLTHRDDKFKDRIGPINEELKISCEERNIGFIDNTNINKYHLNRSKLHLNAKGSAILAKNFKIVTSI